MKKWWLLIIGAGILGGAVSALLFIGPEMKNQPNIRAYQARVPLPPEGVVPVEATTGIPSASEAAAMRDPVQPTADNLARGKTYYGYYCLFCHGEAGEGNGPVGQSFLPPPTDLRSAKLRSLSDGELLRAMLTGIGHRPAIEPPARTSVLEYTVLPEHRWYLVLYLRSLEPPARR